MFDRMPKQSFFYSVILMTIDIPRSGNRWLVDLRMPLDQLIGQPARRF